MRERRGIIIHPEELDVTWPDRLKAAGLNVLGLHPVGGQEACASLERALYHRLLPETRRLFSQFNRMGIEVEYEAHAMSWLLPRVLFASAPHWFRMNEAGERVADYNLCPSQPEALDFVARRAEFLARMLDTGSDRYFLWLDDVSGGKCHCEKCAALSASDQQLLTVNALLRGLRRYRSSARLCYLAYIDAMDVPERVEPLPGVFLEYAPFHRDSHRPLFDESCPENVREVRSLRALLRLFGAEDSQVLEYWMDNSRFSEWKKPPRHLALDEPILREDARAYRALGFSSITSFGCYLGQDYRALWGEPPVREYGAILRAAR